MSLPRAKLKKKLIEKAWDNPVLSSICHQVGVGRATVYRWMNDDPKFKKALEKALERGREAICDYAESSILRLSKSSNEAVALNASKYILNNNSPVYKEANRGYVLSQFEKKMKKALEDQQREMEDRVDRIQVTIVGGKKLEDKNIADPPTEPPDNSS
ncbi:MAG TPA: hypothetical protein PK295_00685 [Candidatus Magasanikbacteria bacterium]|nr:hypothetical protein [Candidatus Magasanikbacteria bacterium]